MRALPSIYAALQAAEIAVNIVERKDQGAIVNLDGYPRELRFYGWRVTDNGQATGTDRNPRASDSLQLRQGLLEAAFSAENGIAVGRNKNGECIVAMKPERFLDYLNQYKPQYHSHEDEADELPLEGRPMNQLVAEAELEEAAPIDDADFDFPTTFDPAMIADGREYVAREIVRRRGQVRFRNMLLGIYGHCVMSGCSVAAALEAAHIMPYFGPGTNHRSNGLLLRADLHTLFDLGLLSVNHETLEILVASDLNGTEYEWLRNQPLRIERNNRFLSREALLLHRNFANL